MRFLAGLSIALLLPFALPAQHRGGSGNFPSGAPRVTGSFGNVLFPGGTAANMPGIRRSFGSVLFPGGGGPRTVVPGTIIDPTFPLRVGATVGGWNAGLSRRDGRGRRITPIFTYPVFVPGMYGDYGYPAESEPPNVTVVYPPQPAPVIINQFGPSDSQAREAASERENLRTYQAPYNRPVEESTASPHYIFAFKDHTVYSAIAYWVDGDTLHYFTSGNQHNQASLSLVDRDLTAKLNKQTGVEVVLPLAK